MNDAIWAAVITAIASVVSNIILNRRSTTEMDQKMQVRQAVTDTKIEELTREVREHNNFARRMPVVEEQINILHEQTKQLQKFHMQ